MELAIPVAFIAGPVAPSQFRSSIVFDPRVSSKASSTSSGWSAEPTAQLTATVVGFAVSLLSRKGSIRRRAARGSRSDAESCESSANLSQCQACGSGLDLARRKVFSAGLSAAAVLGDANEAMAVPIDYTRCMDCVGGLNMCTTCKGSGKVGDNNDCAFCHHTGWKLCGKCFGSGLPQYKLRQYLKDATFKKVLNRTTDNKTMKLGSEEGHLCAKRMAVENNFSNQAPEIAAS
eukprot:TRINITY_DN5019_c0_g1_i2.p1 TRINITY_DN5019_c0_g1~~TRINITY_DN5019_c0_g1_i2.p1  ORF type:complete len:233 (-),score=35.51 TRINITY_DN5019_c0_g1_i2:245-943(-)